MTVEVNENTLHNTEPAGIKNAISNCVDTTTSEPSKVKENQNKKKKGKGKRTPPSPEEIARIREERATQRKAKEEALLTQGSITNCPPELQFIRRPLLELHKGEPQSGFNFSLMTYNCLAQALIRRKLFPDSGDALKWFRRSKVLLYEFMHYKADVICLQEVDHIQYQSFWKEEFGKLGYESQFHRKASKNHGVAIVWKRELFTLTDKMLIDYDKEASGNIPPRTTTNNAGLILALKFSDKVLKQFPNTTKSGILIGTTHLFWHPFGTYERTRQCYVVLNKVKEFLHRVNVLQNNNDGQKDHWIPFFCGDFNSQPFDTPYLSMTSKPVKYAGRAKTVIECSTSYKFSKLREGESGADEEEGGNIEKFGKDQPQTPVPAAFDATPEQSGLVKKMEELHNSLDMRAISLYATGYNRVHPENAGLDNARGEPEISNWAHTWNGLLDYLFYIDSWDFSDREHAETLEDFETNHSIKIRGLLRMPPKSEMEKFGHGQPHTGEYASDHLSMVCNIELLL
ncbi:similar to Saccharomyces cerevisiae YMR285C NGL2 Protein involved in 5.8S rRNA processing [Maudiozyma saulgeensis]|uniref:Similar to Saccharomyces cerevisiae YMR285C NGL2 Protein involved in 5.8S rRNA processing n=1 Tax=Maudiozyma saulgeensis TaxID=1789683 RepID=A0A1X7R8R2_9SACH|nr:similar to Saccharomyces cerevisiae YMR285C NGL2 Protein involved in 5.8S rRNA processing [Kazachstania saulgeensis]